MSHLANLGDVSSSDEESWYDDTAGNLDVFVRLSKAGHFDRAVEYYSQVLKSYDLDFAISASYAASLIEQGAFSDAEAFLDQLSSARKDASAEEHLIIRLFFAITRIYTGCEFDEAAATVCEALQRIGEVDVETAPPLKLQTAILAIRATDLILRGPPVHVSSAFPWRLSCPLKVNDGLETGTPWNSSIIAMLVCGHVWEAVSLLKVCVYHIACELDLVSIVEAVPRGGDAMYTLARLEILVLCVRSATLSGWDAFANTAIHEYWTEIVRTKSEIASRSMDLIDNTIRSSHSFGTLQLLCMDLSHNNRDVQTTGPHTEDSEIHDHHTYRLTEEISTTRANAEEHADHMLFLDVHQYDTNPLPSGWFRKTGASRRAVEILHPRVTLSAESALRIRVITSLIASLKDDDLDVRGSAQFALREQLNIPGDFFNNLLKHNPDGVAEVISVVAQSQHAGTAISDSTISIILDSVKGKDYHTRLDAWKILSRQPYLGRKAVTMALESLKEYNTTDRAVALGRLCKAGSWSEDAFAAIIAVFDDGDLDMREIALQALCCQKNMPPRVIEYQTSRVISADYLVRRAVVTAVEGQEEFSAKTINHMVTMLQDKDAIISNSAARILEKQSSLPGSVIDSICSMLQHKNSTVRNQAARVLGGQSRLPEKIIDIMLPLLQDGEAEVRSTAIEVLIRQPRLTAQALDSIPSALRDPDARIRRKVLKAFDQFPEMSEKALDSIVLLCSDRYPTIRCLAIKELGKLTAVSEKALTSILEGLIDENAIVRHTAIEIAGSQRSLPEHAVLTMVAMLRDTDADNKIAASRAIAKQRKLSESALGIILALLQDNDAATRCATVKTIGDILPVSRALLERIFGATEDDDALVRKTALEILCKETQVSGRMMDTMVGALQDEDAIVRGTSVEMLGRQRPLPEAIVDAMITALQNKRVEVRCAAIEILENDLAASTKAIDAVVHATRDEHSTVRKRAIDALAVQLTLPKRTILPRTRSPFDTKQVNSELSVRRGRHWRVSTSDSNNTRHAARTGHQGRLAERDLVIDQPSEESWAWSDML